MTRAGRACARPCTHAARLGPQPREAPYADPVFQEESTSWELVFRARDGNPAQRAAFVARYGPLVHRWLTRRWNGSRLEAYVDDAVQDVFFECFRDSGALERVAEGTRGTLRRYLLGVVRNVAARHERALALGAPNMPSSFDQLPAPLSSAVEPLDREYANELLREAAAELARRGARLGEAALRRIEMLRLRFHEGLPLREIAPRLGVTSDYVHHQFAKARAEFRDALVAALRARHPGLGAAELERRIESLVQLLR